MRYVHLFESWVNESLTAENIADQIQKATAGLGTDEESLVSAINSIPDIASLVKINKTLKAAHDNPSKNWEYPSVGDAINGELGILDDKYKKQISDHIKKIRAEKYLNAYKAPPPPPDPIITAIKDRVIKHEGSKPTKYLDSRKIPTIGVGFNLTRKDADTKLKKVGANPAKIKAGKASLTQEQINALLFSDLVEAKKQVQLIVPNFGSLPANIQGVLVEMAFNLGKTGLSEFKNFLGKIKNKKFKAASAEMLRSEWAKQVGERAETLASIVKTS